MYSLINEQWAPIQVITFFDEKMGSTTMGSLVELSKPFRIIIENFDELRSEPARLENEWRFVILRVLWFLSFY